jgi:trk system potassium uptake protein TrkH
MRPIVRALFFLAVAIVGIHIIEFGVSDNLFFNYASFRKWLHLIFSFVAVVTGVFLFLQQAHFIVRILRIIFLVVSAIYFCITFMGLLSGKDFQIDWANAQLFLSLTVAFIAISFKIADFGNAAIHPALLFILSFAFVILMGTFGLMLPEASQKPVSFLQALFTSTSAVTVTGLTVLDTGKDFTFLGQCIIMMLLQLGGLGILTITNLFALVFQSSSSFRNRLMVGDMIKEINNKDTFNTLFKIILFTLAIELTGGLFIYIFIYGDRAITSSPVFFSLFHSVSAFCNGGFSTLSNNLYESTVRYNYAFQMTIAWLIITGGIGYTVMINHYLLLKNKLHAVLIYLGITPKIKGTALIRPTLNTKIVIRTTIVLLTVGTGLFMVSEYNGTLQDHSLPGKIMVSFFNAVTPRTAGFNNINMAELGIPAIMLTMALMWIGASPGSTGGGIKTTTFTIALLNLWNQIKGREKLIVLFREVPQAAINQINAVMLLSIFAISFGTFILAYFEPGLLFKDLLFECISAYSTVGLSVGITPNLSETSHITLIILMFLGRVSFLTFLIGVFNSLSANEKRTEVYYSKESVIIN